MTYIILYEKGTREREQHALNRKNAFVMERRQHIRYRLSEYHYQIFDHNNFAIGWIIDISDQGLSYEYIPKNAAPDAKDMIYIFPSYGNGAYVPAIKCKRVYDIKSVDEEICHIPVEFRRCGLKLTGLTQNQRKRYQELLEEIKSHESATI